MHIFMVLSCHIAAAILRALLLLLQNSKALIFLSMERQTCLQLRVIITLRLVLENIRKGKKLGGIRQEDP
jgi:hypothetical protein